jgi:hypothetical protein
MAQGAGVLAIDQRPWLWALLVTLILYVWAFVFWYLFFNLLSWEVLQIPMGLGGAIYPVFFSLPVVAFTGLYEVIIVKRRLFSPRIRQHYLLFTVGVPAILVPIALILFCPMDTQMSYLEYVLTQRIF